MPSKARSLFLAMFIACHLAVAAVAGSVMATAIWVHDLVSHQHDEPSGHHHHLAITHVDHGHHDATHHHSADNFQPNALAHADVSFMTLCKSQSFCNMIGGYLPEIYPDGLLRPPRALL